MVGVPESVPSALNEMPPATSVGLIENVGAGEPVIPVNEKLYEVPTVAEPGVPVKSGATFVLAGATSTVNCFTASGVTPFVAVTVTGNDPAFVGVPDSTPAELSV